MVAGREAGTPASLNVSSPQFDACEASMASTVQQATAFNVSNNMEVFDEDGTSLAPSREPSTLSQPAARTTPAASPSPTAASPLSSFDPASPLAPESPKFPPKKKHESAAPKDTPYAQQRMYAWQPTYGPFGSMLCLFIVAAAFIPLGAMVLVASNDIQNVHVRYDNHPNLRNCPWVIIDSHGYDRCFVDNCDVTSTHECANTRDCGMIAKLAPHCPRNFTRASVESWPQDKLLELADCDPHCPAYIDFNLTETMKGPVFLYYELKRFNQNHRKYVSSRSETQIAGDQPRFLAECEPILRPGKRGVDKFCEDNMGTHECEDVAMSYGSDVRAIGDLTYAPCGLPAWSMFNDSLALLKINDTDRTSKTLVCDGELLNDPPSYNEESIQEKPNLGFGYGNTTNRCRKEGISWKVDRDKKFREPQWTDTLFDARGLRNASITTPHKAILPYLLYGWYMFEPYHRLPYQKDEDFMVWSRVAMLPTFRKLYRAIDGDLPPGQYRMEIKHRFDVRPFGGEKAFVLATTSWTGGDMTFIAVLLLTLGIISFVACVVFSALNIVNFRERRDALEEWKLESQRRIPLYNGQVQELEEDIEA